jgi:parvulin-like peptidyl-prolyl isomerase
MKFFALFFCLFVSMLPAQTPPPQAPPALQPETVVATIGDRKLTYGQMQSLLNALPPNMRQNAMQNRKEFIRQFALMLKLAKIAEEAKVDQQSPYKEFLEFNRVNILAQAQIQEEPRHIPVEAHEQQAFYDANKDRYNQVKLKVIYLPFSPNPVAGPNGKKPRTEAEAKADADRLLKEIRGGADFVKLVKEYSEDTTSAAKDGDFGTISRSDSVPDVIRDAIFKLKAGEVSEPVRQPNGYYLFKAEQIISKSFQDVRDDIFHEIQMRRMKEWMDSMNKSLNITFDNEAYFATPPPGPAPATAPQIPLAPGR